MAAKFRYSELGSARNSLFIMSEFILISAFGAANQHDAVTDLWVLRLGLV